MNKKTAMIGLACVICCVAGGCYDSRQVNAFLCQKRVPISGVEYRALPPDMLQVSSRHVPEIHAVREGIRPDGKINLPLIGEIEAAGKTPREIELAINQAASRYYAEVDSTIQIIGYNSQRYYVFGQVSAPGPRPWTGHDTLLDALAMAQPTNLAWPERIWLIRGSMPQEGGQTMPNTDHYRMWGVHPEENEGMRHKMLINLMAMVNEGDLANNVLLMPNDVIYVQPNPLAKIGLAIQNLLFPIRPAAEAVITPRAAATGIGM